MIYSIHEGLFSKSKNKKTSKRVNKYYTESYSQNNQIPKYLYIIGNDIKDALSTGDAYRSALDAVRFTLFSKYYADHIPSENKIEIPKCFANDALNMHISIYKIPSYKCNASIKYGKITISFKGSDADCIEEFNGTISDFVSYNKIRAVIYDPPFKNIAECKSTLSKVQKFINDEFKGVKGIKNTTPDDYEIKFFTFYKDETLYVASIDQRDSEYDLASNEFYKLIDQGLKNINSKLQSMGLILVDDWDKYEGMIFLTHINKANKPTIFSECHFMYKDNNAKPINEGLLNGVLALLYIPMTLFIVTLAASKIGSIHERNEILKSLDYALNNNKNLKVLKDKMKKGVRIISAKQLSERIKISDKDIDIIETNDISVMIIVDNNDKIIAYCLVTPLDNKLQYGYHIVDKSIANSKEADNYIKASFELKLGIVGDGIKHFYKGNGNWLMSNSKTANALSGKANYLSKDKSIALHAELQEFAVDLYDDINSITDADVELSDNGVEWCIRLTSDELSDASENLNPDDYDEFEEKSAELYEIYKEKVEPRLKKYGFKLNESTYRSNIDKYRFFKIRFEVNSSGGEFVFDIIISSSKK